MDQPEPTPAQRRLLGLLRRLAPVSPPELAAAAGISSVAVREQLQALDELGLVHAEVAAPRGRGRPASLWSPNDAAAAYLPDAHPELAVGLLAAVRSAVGEVGLGKVLEARGAQQAESYAASLRPGASLANRVKALARLRSGEGYMAEARKDPDGGWLLIEHHCPVCEAARHCQGLCQVELEVFQKVLGPDVHVARTEHLLADGRRCIYSIRPRKP